MTQSSSSEKENQEQQQQQQQQEDESEQQQQQQPSCNNDSNNNNANSNDNTTNTKIVINETRVRDSDGFVGTIQYLGPVASAKNPSEIYAGIEWDDYTRGKHDGSVICRKTKQLIRHFSTKYPTQGSFMRLSKLDFGLQLSPQLLQTKYVDMEAPLVAPNNLLEHTATTSKGHSKPIEFVGELQIRQKQQLDVVDKISLRRQGISKAYRYDYQDDSSNSREANAKANNDSTTTSSSCCDDDDDDGLLLFNNNNILHLDLAGNLFSNWDEIIMILKQFPNLEDFSIAYNRIRDIINIDIDSIGIGNDNQQQQQPSLVFPNMKIFNLNHCNIEKITTIQWISRIMPNLQQLCISSSRCFDNMYIDQQGSSGSLLLNFQNLITLDCSNCNLRSWSKQIVPLFRDLPNLQHLCLDDNSITSIDIQPTKSEISSRSIDSSSSPSTYYFPNLQSIQISGTNISEWINIEGLNYLQKLKSLKLKNTPLTKDKSQSSVRFMAIARYPNIEYFNSSLISSREREEANKRYVTFVTKLLLLEKTKNANNNINSSNTKQQQQTQGDDNDGFVIKDDDGSTTNEQQKQQQDDDDIYIEQHILAEHPQYVKLKETYQNLISAQQQQNQNGTTAANGGSGGFSNISSTILNVTIRSMVPSSCSMEPLIKRLPGTLTVGRLKALCCRSFGFVQDIDLMSLHFRNNMNDPFPTELDNDDNNLNYYGVCDGAEILMNEIDLSTKQQEEKLLKEQHEQQILKEERTIKMKMDEMKRMKQ